MANPSGTRRALEENMLAIIDSSGVKESRDLHDDRMSFLEAVRAMSMHNPTRRIYGAVFDIWRKDEGDLEAVMACYQILTDLGQRYPRIRLSDSDKNVGSGGGGKEVVVDKEGWSPFLVSFNGHVDGESNSQNSNDLLDPYGFSLLLQEVVQALTETVTHISTNPLKDMLLFEYLVNDLERDFLPRQTVYKETLNWILLRESLLNMLLFSRRLTFKGFLRDCMTVICKRGNLHDLNRSEDCDQSLKLGLSEIANKTCLSVQKLLILVMELDVIKNEASTLGYTSRADGMRTPSLEIILDELTYNKDLISSFLQGFSEAKWKLEIILRYFWKYCSKPSIQTRNSSKVDDSATFGAVLKYISDSKNNKRINRTITADVAMLLLAYAFQAYLYLHDDPKYDASKKGSSLLEICKGVISAFKSLQKSKDDEMTPLEKEALFTATALSTKACVT